MRKLCCDDKKLLCLNMSRLRLLCFQVTETRTKLAWAKGRIYFLTRSMDALNKQTMGRENMQLDLRNKWKEGPKCCQDSSFSSLLFMSSFVPLQTTFLHVVGTSSFTMPSIAWRHPPRRLKSHQHGQSSTETQQANLQKSLLICGAGLLLGI